MLRLTKQQKEWCRIMETSTNPQEIIETAAKLKMDPVTMEEAEEIAEMHKQDGQEKGFMELLRELLATDDLTKKEAIYEKIVEQERKRVREASQKEKGGEKV